MGKCALSVRDAQHSSITGRTPPAASHMSAKFLMLLLIAAIAGEQLAAASKFAYKKPLYGKSSFAKEKRFKLRATGSTTAAPATTTSTSTEADWPASVEFIINSSPRSSTPAAESSTEGSGGIYSGSSTPSSSNSLPGSSSSASNTITTTITSTTPSSLINTLPTPPMPPKKVAATETEPVPCTCGVFLSSQIRNGLPEKPLIHNEMDRMYPCNAIGRKQCQTKCLEAIVQHLPNSANIVCATLGHNCHKERAYLFIKNCHNQWVNTNLQAGREYCCKEGTPYRCPLLG
ncbi:hypothetical protein KR222_008935 [Zaprionus bogoriensis]|nr:hypothetical protein KR222_008935 [Zaprionus bogoriensis]